MNVTTIIIIVIFLFSKVKQRAYYGKWTESFYSYDPSLYNDYTVKSSMSLVSQPPHFASSDVSSQEPVVSR